VEEGAKVEEPCKLKQQKGLKNVFDFCIIIYYNILRLIFGILLEIFHLMISPWGFNKWMLILLYSTRSNDDKTFL
jgi:hypothetical protein